jgi:hypothetical protein
MAKKSILEVVDTHGLTDAVWAAINNVIRAYSAGGMDAFFDELEKLGDNNVALQIKVVGAIFPAVIREAIKEEIGEHGFTLEDLPKFVTRLH